MLEGHNRHKKSRKAKENDQNNGGWGHRAVVLEILIFSSGTIDTSFFPKNAPLYLRPRYALAYIRSMNHICRLKRNDLEIRNTAVFGSTFDSFSC